MYYIIYIGYEIGLATLLINLVEMLESWTPFNQYRHHGGGAYDN